MKRIGLFGGSFDPIHKAHLMIAKKALTQLQLDELQFIPTKNNPWKDHGCADAKDRVAMIEMMIQDEPQISINSIELDSQSNEKNYTIDTLKILTKQNPDTQYFYIMGMDQANLFDKWKGAKKISHMVQLVAFQRGDYEPDYQMIQKFSFILLDNEPVSASSSDVRKGHIEMIDPQVLKYITYHGLYLDSMIKPRMKEKRWRHTCSVAKLAQEIAKSNHLNDRQAYIAGMFHDVAKEMDYEQSLSIMKKQFPQYIDKPVAIWHQWLSRYVTEKEFLVDDAVILKAIEDHTTASLNISAIGKCVYVADKLDPLRGYDSSMQIKKCKENIDEGFKNELMNFYEFSKKKGRDIDECFFEIYDHFVIKGEI